MQCDLCAPAAALEPAAGAVLKTAVPDIADWVHIQCEGACDCRNQPRPSEQLCGCEFDRPDMRPAESTMLEWRNWQTHWTQNPAPFAGHEGSTPSSSTKPDSSGAAARMTGSAEPGTSRFGHWEGGLLGRPSSRYALGLTGQSALSSKVRKWVETTGHCVGTPLAPETAQVNACRAAVRERRAFCTIEARSINLVCFYSGSDGPCSSRTSCWRGPLAQASLAQPKQRRQREHYRWN